MVSARRILAFDWLTADGYFAGFDGNLNWVVPEDEQAKAAAAGTAAAERFCSECGASPALACPSCSFSTSPSRSSPTASRCR